MCSSGGAAHLAVPEVEKPQSVLYRIAGLTVETPQLTPRPRRSPKSAKGGVSEHTERHVVTTLVQYQHLLRDRKARWGPDSVCYCPWVACCELRGLHEHGMLVNLVSEIEVVATQELLRCGFAAVSSIENGRSVRQQMLDHVLSVTSTRASRPALAVPHYYACDRQEDHGKVTIRAETNEPRERNWKRNQARKSSLQVTNGGAPYTMTCPPSRSLWSDVSGNCWIESPRYKGSPAYGARQDAVREKARRRAAAAEARAVQAKQARAAKTKQAKRKARASKSRAPVYTDSDSDSDVDPVVTAAHKAVQDCFWNSDEEHGLEDSDESASDDDLDTATRDRTAEFETGAEETLRDAWVSKLEFTKGARRPLYRTKRKVQQGAGTGKGGK